MFGKCLREMLYLSNICSNDISGTAVVNPSACIVGHYCPEGTGFATKFPCPAGTYGPDLYYESLDNCTQCPSGFYCEEAGLSVPTGECRAGFYCTGGASSSTPIDDMVSTVPTEKTSTVPAELPLARP